MVYNVKHCVIQNSDVYTLVIPSLLPSIIIIIIILQLKSYHVEIFIWQGTEATVPEPVMEPALWGSG